SIYRVPRRKSDGRIIVSPVGSVDDHPIAPADELLCNVREMLSDCCRIRRVDLGNNEKRAASTHGHCDITGIVIAKLLVVCAAWLVISVLLAGVGALVRTRFGSRIADETDLFFDWWVGWAVTIAYLL